MNIGTVVGLIKGLTPDVDPAVIEKSVQDWLDDHPEATTTVQDGSITEAKLASVLAAKINGAVSDVSDLKSAIQNNLYKSTGNMLDFGAVGGTWQQGGYCERHHRPLDIKCVNGTWVCECPKCRAEGLLDTYYDIKTTMMKKQEWTASNHT